MISPSRRVAHAVLEAVAEGGFASDLLHTSGARLSSRDAGLTAQIVFGCLRFQSQLDFLIEHFAKRTSSSLDRPVVIALRSAIFQLRYLDRIPAHAAVDEAVQYVKQKQRAASGLVNAVLRKVTRDAVKFPNESIALSCPGWLLARWGRHYGTEFAQKIALAALEEPSAYIRVAPGKSMPENVDLEATDIPGCYRLLSGLPPPDVRLHDIGSQSVLPHLRLEPGNTYLDLCAAPGNKTSQALEAPVRFAIACDISRQRLEQVPAVCPRVVLDATEPLPFSGPFNRIFLDAPCSGTGTLGRNPEIKWRVQAGDFTRLAEKQVQMVRQASRVLAPGGLLLYATCSLEGEENEEVIATVLQSQPELELVEQGWRLPGREAGDGFFHALLQLRP